MAIRWGEIADKFMVHLRKQAHHCNFGTLEDSLHDHQVIEKLPSIKWKNLIEVKNVSSGDAMDKVRLWESAREQAIQMVSPSQDTDISTNTVGTKQGSGNICFNCRLWQR